MKVIFKTNIDHYQTNCFPTNLEIPPRIGETVLVAKVFVDYYTKKKLPISMVVVNVTWTDRCVICELWYNKNDVEAAKLSGINLF